MGGLGSFHRQTCRCKMLYCKFDVFFKSPYFGLVNCRTQAFSVFDNTSVKSRSLQIKLIPNVISNMLIILALKMRWKMVLNNAETNIFQWDMLFLAVPAGSVSRCLVTYSNNWSFWRARTSV